ncbi:MAG: hypothetical protein IH986_01515 [Planctomycetes bacterium]|nr:hypothetical protein [Planctomycetota bacterium]
MTITRETTEAAVGEAAGKYGMVVVERSMRLAGAFGKPNATPPILVRPDIDSVFRPRVQVTSGVPPLVGELAPQPAPGFDFEPFVKVRPLISLNFNAKLGLGLPMAVMPDRGEELIRAWLLGTGRPTLSTEVDFPLGGPFADVNGDGILDSRVFNPVLSAIARTYPPVSSVTRLDPDDFFSNGQYRVTLVSEQEREMRKALDRTIGWTAFYRRVSYAEGSDPNLYEIIVIATRRPGRDFRFGVQDESAPLGARWGPQPPMGGGSGSQQGEQAAALAESSERETAGIGPNFDGNGGEPVAGAAGNGAFGGTIARAVASTVEESAAPSAWLVLFTVLPPLPDLVLGDPNRAVDPLFEEAATLSFKCTASVGALLPVGSIFIPAVNDDRPGSIPGQVYVSAVPGVQISGFVPHSPTILPIYKVVERPDLTTVIVKNPGVYPWVNPNAATPLSQHWPVWVIPPSFKEHDSNGRPIFENRSSVLSVTRRYIRLREIP